MGRHHALHRAVRLAVRCGLVVLGLAAIAGCTVPGTLPDALVKPATLLPRLDSTEQIEALPAPARALDVAVYSFPDVTGQNKSEQGFSSFSRAVTQGADSILIDVMEKAGGGHWFNVVERGGIQELAQERQIIERTRTQFQGPNAKPLAPLRFAGIIMRGGIVAFDSNETTGGAGARFLGVGGDTQYRRDVITVALRAVSVETGDILSSVTTTKTVYSIGVRGSQFRFVAFDELLELEAGLTRNEPTSFAVRQAVELAVFSLVLEGSKEGLWSFSDPDAEARVHELYERIYKRTRRKGSTEIPRVRPDGQPSGERSVSARATIVADAS